jgi:heme exporter protein C
MSAMSWRATGLAGLAVLLAASGLIATGASREFYGVDHPVNLLFYFHVGVAWVGFAGLLVATVASVAFLRRPVLRRSWVAQAAVRVSFAFLTLTLVTGMMWGRFIWNSWWEWSDIRLVTALVVWFIYAGYLLYHQQVSDVAGYRRGAVFCILAFVSVPITVASTRLWQSPFHGSTVTTESVAIHGSAFAMTLVGMSAVYFYLVSLRWRLEAAEHGSTAGRRSEA